MASPLEQHDSFNQAQSALFTRRQPNAYLTGYSESQNDTVLGDSLSALATFDPDTRQTRARDVELQNFALGVTLADKVKNQEAMCRSMSLDQLRRQDPNAAFRCGIDIFTDEFGNQQIQGRAGTAQGAISLTQGFANQNDSQRGFATVNNMQSNLTEGFAGDYYFDIDAAEKKILADRCAKLVDCADVGKPEYKDCAFSTSRGIGIPVNADGTVLYPNDPGLSAPQSSLIMSAAKCPPPPAPGSAAQNRLSVLNPCIPNTDGSVSRNCVLQQVKDAGCSTKGTLYLALSQGSDQNQGVQLTKEQSFRMQQQQARTPLQNSVINDGSSGKEAALKNFKALHTFARGTANTAANYAARDLCMQKGEIDKQDFCSDINDTTRGPFALECLQKLFRLQGGQPAGTDQPTPMNKGNYDALGTWANVKKYIEQLKKDAGVIANANGWGDVFTSESLNNQEFRRMKIRAFYGMMSKPPPPAIIQRTDGVEMYYFNIDLNRAFIGRRIQGEMPLWSPNRTENNGLFTAAPNKQEQIAITNLRPDKDYYDVQFKITTDEGSIVSLNDLMYAKRALPTLGSSESVDIVGQFARNQPQAPTSHLSTSKVNIRKGYLNFFTHQWWDWGGTSANMVEIVNGTQQGKIPSSWFSLAQSPDAPMLAFETLPLDQNEINGDRSVKFRERRIPMAFPTQQTGALETRVGGEIAFKLNGTNNITINRPIARGAWRTLTYVLTLSAMPVSSWQQSVIRAPNVGVQAVSINGRAYLSFLWWSDTFKTIKYAQDVPFSRDECDRLGGTQGSQGNCGNLSQKFGHFIGPVPVGEPLYIQINMRADYRGSVPNRATQGVFTLDQVKKGNFSLSPTNQNVVSITTDNNKPLYNQNGVNAGEQEVDKVGQEPIRIGAWWQNTSAAFELKSIHMFDQEMTKDDCILDANNTFPAQWINQNTPPADAS